tara:strand:+ start:2571 stop:3170 length:600 start_codon:yes stop_codon:yes gene_type:complete
MKARYIRISTASQNLERQLVKQHPNETLFIDVVSGSIPFHQREQGLNLLKAVEDSKFNFISIHSIDRLGRNLLDILNTLKVFEDCEVTVKVDNLGIESMVNRKPNPAFKLIISVLANISEMERETLLERQQEGIAIAKAKGKYKGRLRGTKMTTNEIINKYPIVVKNLRNGQSMRNTAKLSDVSLGTVQKVNKYLSISV